MIKNLTLQLNEAGKIKIGRKGKQITSAQGNEFRPPEKLDHFQLVTTEKDTEGDFQLIPSSRTESSPPVQGS